MPKKSAGKAGGGEPQPPPAKEPKTTVKIYPTDLKTLKKLVQLRELGSTADVLALPEVRGLMRNLVLQAAAKISEDA